MKANVNSKKNSKIDNNSGIILSIGMIVKNEEKVLERCLKSLQPLMEAIPSELIIADTGSTDSSVEIAQKYTDNVFHFEWINDFAAARNSTLEKARGQWYFFIDADEYFDDDIDELIGFFRIEELRSKYKTVELPVRSYFNEEKTNYRDTNLTRFHRIDDPKDPVHFIGTVHEGIWIRNPLGCLSTILHHTGYCFSSTQQNANKKNRNLDLMRDEYKKNPKDLRILSHIIDGTVFEVLEQEKYISEALEILKTNRKDLYSNVLYMQAISHYEKSRPEYALELCEEYYKGVDDNDKKIATMGVVLSQARIYAALARYEEASEYYKKYMCLYEEYKKGNLDMTDLSAHPVEGMNESEYTHNVFACALCYKNLRRYNEAFALLELFDPEELKGYDFKEFLGVIREICKHKKDYVMLAKYYERISASESKDKRSLAVFMLESAYFSIDINEKRIAFANDIANSGAKGKYIELMKLVIASENGETDIQDRIVDFISDVDDWDNGYSEALYLAIKHGVDISRSVLGIKSVYFRTKLESIANIHDDFARCVLNYGIPESFASNIKSFFWIVSMNEKASYRAFELDDKLKHELYSRFARLLGDYVLNIYNPELLNDEDIDILPEFHQFGYHMHNAMNFYDSSDYVGYIRSIKKALVSCESMKEIVQFMLEQFKKNM